MLLGSLQLLNSCSLSLYSFIIRLPIIAWVRTMPHLCTPSNTLLPTPFSTFLLHSTLFIQKIYFFNQPILFRQKEKKFNPFFDNHKVSTPFPILSGQGFRLPSTISLSSFVHVAFIIPISLPT